MGNPLFARKPMSMLLSEAQEEGGHSLKRTLGPFQLTALGVGAIIGAGIFVLSGLGAHYAGPGLMLSFVLSGLGCAFAGLCYAEFAAMIPLAGSAYTYAYATLGELFAWIIGWDLTLEYAMGASTVSSGWSNHFIELLNIFHIKMPLWLAYDHWTGLHTATKIVARQMAQASDAALQPGTQAFLDKVDAIMKAQSPELVQSAHTLLNAPTMFGVEIGFNLPAFIIALVITAIGIIVSLLICTILYIAVAGVLTGMVHWQDVNIEAPIARAFLDRGLTTASHVITLGALAGLTSVMLVMLLGQTRVLYSMANDGLLPKKFFAAIHPKFRTPYKNTMLVGLLAAIVGSVTPIDDIGKMVNIGTLLAFVIVCIAVLVLRRINPSQPRPFRTPWVPVVPVLGIVVNGYMMYKLGWINWARLITWLVIGLVIYFTYSRKHSRINNPVAR